METQNAEKKSSSGTSPFTIIAILVLGIIWIYTGKNPFTLIFDKMFNAYDSFVKTDTKKESETLVITPERIFLNKLQSAMDIENETTRIFALNLAAKYPGEYNIDQICSVYDELKNNWAYVNDPRGIEYVAKASTSIKAGLKGDCDDFAVLMATMIESIGGSARIVAAYNENTGHAYTEVFIGNADKMNSCLEAINRHYTNFFEQAFGVSTVDRLNYHTDANGNAWLNLDWTSKYPGGKYFDATRRTFYYPRENMYLN